MIEQARDNGDTAIRKLEERKEFHSYVWGIALALVLTLVPFALVHWAAMPGLPLLGMIGAFALVQMVVHFRFFLHIGFRQKREDLLLILFSTLLMVIMVAGTIWIMASLAMRMTLPVSSVALYEDVIDTHDNLAKAMASYTVLRQEAGQAPMVEPEVLMEVTGT